MSNLPRAYRKYNLLFTPALIPHLRDLRESPEWVNLIDKLSALPETDPDTLAFAMMVIEIGGCLSCEMDSYRAQKGCVLCARHTILNFKGSDQQLIKHFEQARQIIASQFADDELKRAA